MAYETLLTELADGVMTVTLNRPDKLNAFNTVMPDTSPATIEPKLSAVEPELFVADIKTACEWFTSKLGFEVAFTYGEPPFYGQVKRDKAAINLRLVCEPVYVGDIREREELLGASMTVDSAAEIKQLFLQYQSAGIDFFRPLKQEPWPALAILISFDFETAFLKASP